MSEKKEIEFKLPESLLEKCKQKDAELAAKKTVERLQGKEEEKDNTCSLDDPTCDSCGA